MGERASSENKNSIEREHRELQSLLCQAGAMDDLGELLPTLKQLRRLLEQHFRNEEGEDGLHSLIPQQAPRLTGRVDGLLDEHSRFLETATSLIQVCESLIDGPRALREEIEAFSDKLQLHDQAETELMNEAFLTDLGSGD